MVINEVAINPVPDLPNFLNLTDHKYDRWTVQGFAYKIKNLSYWWCKCECGTLKKVTTGSLRSQNSRSCGCLARELAVIHATNDVIHGEKRGGKSSPEYRAFGGAKSRCQNPNNKAYPNYGGRGIEFKFNTFKDFLAEVGRKPSDKHSLDRYPDNNGHYETGNVRWATWSEQQRNRRSNRLITLNGTVKCVEDWAITSPVSADTILHRLHRKWCATCSIQLPIGKRCSHRF